MSFVWRVAAQRRILMPTLNKADKVAIARFMSMEALGGDDIYT